MTTLTFGIAIVIAVMSLMITTMRKAFGFREGIHIGTCIIIIIVIVTGGRIGYFVGLIGLIKF
jgi:hypothetical protein